MRKEIGFRTPDLRVVWKCSNESIISSLIDTYICKKCNTKNRVK